MNELTQLNMSLNEKGNLKITYNYETTRSNWDL